jgi:hypothetical protein
MAAVKKRDPRRVVNQAAWITLEGGFAARPCSVIDLSKTGAKVQMQTVEQLPSNLRLTFSRDGRTGRPCEVLWRRGKTVGVRFLTPD